LNLQELGDFLWVFREPEDRFLSRAGFVRNTDSGSNAESVYFVYVTVM